MNGQFYETVFETLARGGYRRLADVERASHTHREWVKDEEWAADLFEHVVSHGEAEARAAIQSPRARILFRNLVATPAPAMGSIVRRRASYACLFPRRVVFTSGRFGYRGESAGGRVSNVYCIPLDYIAQALSLRPLLLAGLTSLFPTRVRLEDAWGLNFWSALQPLAERSLATVESEGVGASPLSDALDAIPSRARRGALIRSPLLTGVDAEHYVDLMESDPESFHLFDRAVSQLVTGESTTESAMQEAVGQIEIATARLNRSYSQKRRALDVKGVTVGLGTATTVAATLSTNVAALATAIGSATALEAISYLGDLRNAKDELKTDDYWFLWRVTKRGRRSDRSKGTSSGTPTSG